ncbi:MAG: diguanylate cyclase domain-containing protein [bacterium]
MTEPGQKRLEYIDDLTGLYNRRHFRGRLLEQKRKADQSASGGLALMMVDVARGVLKAGFGNSVGPYCSTPLQETPQ